jgi:hypothetical protein
MLDARISRAFRVSKPKTLNPCPLQVADFGLSVMLDADETHMSNMYQGTLTHMVCVCKGTWWGM